MAWIDITAAANWASKASFHGGSHFPSPPSPPWFLDTNQGEYYNTSDSSSADGIYYEFVGGIWTPTLAIGSAPTGGMVPFLQYVGDAFADLEDVRITVRNRASMTLGADLVYHGPFNDGSAVPSGSYTSGETFVLSFGVFGRSGEFDDTTADLAAVLNRMYSIVATLDDDFATFCDSPRVLFDILKIEVDATPPVAFWTDFQNTVEQSGVGLTKVFHQVFVPGTQGQEGQAASLSCPEPPPPGAPPSPPGSGGAPPCGIVTVCQNVGHGVFVCIPLNTCP